MLLFKQGAWPTKLVALVQVQFQLLTSFYSVGFWHTAYLTLQWWYSTEFWPLPSHSKVGKIRGCPYQTWELKVSCFLFVASMYIHIYFAFLSHFKGCLRYVLQHLKICSAAHLWTQVFTHKLGMDCSGEHKVSNSLESLWEKGQGFGFHSQTPHVFAPPDTDQASLQTLSYFMARWEPD